MQANLIEVAFDPGTRIWTVYARADASQEFGSWDANEENLDQLLAIARDVATGS